MLSSGRALHEALARIVLVEDLDRRRAGRLALLVVLLPLREVRGLLLAHGRGLLDPLVELLDLLVEHLHLAGELGALGLGLVEARRELVDAVGLEVEALPRLRGLLVAPGLVLALLRLLLDELLEGVGGEAVANLREDVALDPLALAAQVARRRKLPLRERVLHGRRRLNLEEGERARGLLLAPLDLGQAPLRFVHTVRGEDLLRLGEGLQLVGPLGALGLELRRALHALLLRVLQVLIRVRERGLHGLDLALRARL